MRFARAEDALMQGVAKVLDAKLVGIGHAAVREITTEANRQGVGANDLAYVFWALASQSGLPKMPKQVQAAFDLMVVILTRSKTMPNYGSAFRVTDSMEVEAATDAVAMHMGTWARTVMFPALFHAYKAALTSQVKAVPAATGNRVRPEVAFDFLRKSFRQVLDISSRKFRDGELLRRVVRILPI